MTGQCRMYRIFFVLCFSIVALADIHAQQSFVKNTSDVLCLAPAATGLVKAIAEKDKDGVVQLGLSTATAIALNYGINACVRKNRPAMPLHPDWSDHHAFPSTHAMAAFDGATFLMRRYGWQWAVPAYVASTYVAWGRTYTNHHDCWDVIAGALVGTGAALIYTRPFMKNLDLAVTPVALEDNGVGVHVCLTLR